MNGMGHVRGGREEGNRCLSCGKEEVHSLNTGTKKKVVELTRGGEVSTEKKRGGASSESDAKRGRREKPSLKKGDLSILLRGWGVEYQRKKGAGFSTEVKGEEEKKTKEVHSDG